MYWMTVILKTGGVKSGGREKLFVFTVSCVVKVRFGRSVNIILFIRSTYVFNFYNFSGRPTRRDYVQQTHIL